MGPEIWGLIGVISTGLLAIIAEQIRNSRKQSAALAAIEEVSQDVKELSDRVNQHITWHLNPNSYQARHRW